jgi:hypothetical protein
MIKMVMLCPSIYMPDKEDKTKQMLLRNSVQSKQCLSKLKNYEPQHNHGNFLQDNVQFYIYIYILLITLLPL